MKHIYIQNKSLLFTGLLTLGALSSCINTKPTLRVKDKPEKTNFGTKKILQYTAGAFVGAAAVAGSLYGAYNAVERNAYNKGYNDGAKSCNQPSNINNTNRATLNVKRP
ncbi:hypothetical protein [Candidatus Cardinium sp. cBcalN2]|uniref:hypothetical protein n=2 Tax=unclassified Candidatus Cardinium TaxID=2641185 RepID=UPI001FB3167D|nr:hypothetical protein [Candidatus Cardinium sp. cBcalN2]